MRPRIRTIKPEIWADERVGDLSHGARLLFIGLITMADDEGRLRELPAAILGHVFPYDDISTAKLSKWLTEIAATGMIVRYTVDGRRYVAFPRWTTHQKVDKGNESSLPVPPEFVESSPNDSTNGRRSVSDVFDDDSRPVRARSASRADPIRSFPDPVRCLFDYWKATCRHPQALPTRERLAKVRARLGEGYTEDQIRQAINGAARAAFVNDAGKRFDDLELICRNGSKLESFIDRADGPNVVALPRAAALERADAWKAGYEEGAS